MLIYNNLRPVPPIAMCHEIVHTREALKDEIARELLEEGAFAAEGDEAAEEELPSFLNDEREADVDLLTDGGTDEA